MFVGVPQKGRHYHAHMAGKKYQEAAKLIDPKKIYSIEEAAELVKKTNVTKFDATVEVHIRLGIDPKIPPMVNATMANSAAPTGTHWGPYLQAVPINPLNGMTGVSSAASDANAGWYYQPAGLGFTFYSRNADGSVNTAY